MTHKRQDLFHLNCPVLHAYVHQWTIPGVAPLFRPVGCTAAGLGPIPCELLCWWAIFTPDIMLTLLTASTGPRRHDNFFTPNTFFPRAVCGLWCWSRHLPDRGTAGKSVNDVSSFWREKMSPNIFCGPVYQPRSMYIGVTSHRVILSSVKSQRQ